MNPTINKIEDVPKNLIAKTSDPNEYHLRFCKFLTANVCAVYQRLERPLPYNQQITAD